jgi:hypothetical protein
VEGISAVKASTNDFESADKSQTMIRGCFFEYVACFLNFGGFPRLSLLVAYTQCIVLFGDAYE